MSTDTPTPSAQTPADAPTPPPCPDPTLCASDGSCGPMGGVDLTEATTLEEAIRHAARVQTESYLTGIGESALIGTERVEAMISKTAAAPGFRTAIAAAREVFTARHAAEVKGLRAELADVRNECGHRMWGDGEPACRLRRNHPGDLHDDLRQYQWSAPTPPAGDAEEVRADACPHCAPTHRDPTSRPWGVYVAPAVDADGQPEYLIVRPSNGAHVAESDATWLWELIRNA